MATDEQGSEGDGRERFAVGRVIAGRYALWRVVGEGGMASVWAAKHLVTGREVAIKFLRASHTDDAEFRRRFLKEARATAQLGHANVVDVLDAFETPEGVPALVMPLLHGETLAHKLQREGALTMNETASLLVPVISALGAAHALGIIHRDIKPANIFLLQNSALGTNVRVLDFGIAKWAQPEEQGSPTESGVVIGTPCYMSPEQATLECAVDYRTDVWALGAIIYECLAGQRALSGDSVGKVVAQLLTQGIVPIGQRVPKLPRDVAQMVDAMLERKRDARDGSLERVRQVLEGHTSVRAAAIPAPAAAAIAGKRPQLETDASAETARVRKPPERASTAERDPDREAQGTGRTLAVSSNRERPSKPTRRLSTWVALCAIGVVALVTMALRGEHATLLGPAAASQVKLSPAVSAIVPERQIPQTARPAPQESVGEAPVPIEPAPRQAAPFVKRAVAATPSVASAPAPAPAPSAAASHSVLDYRY